MFHVDLKSFLGSGWYGTVYRGTLNFRPVAAKKCQDTFSLHSEADFLRLCDHANIIKCYGVFEFGGTAFLVTELAEAGTLQAHLGKRKFSTDTKEQIIQQICLGLEHMHRRGLAHRDIKVENLLLKSTAPPHIVIGDFGSVKLLSQCSRERIKHDVVSEEVYTPKSDVFLLATVAWQIFEDRSHVCRLSVARDIRNRGLNAEIFWNKKWYDAIRNSLVEDPDARPTVNEFRNAFA